MARRSSSRALWAAKLSGKLDGLAEVDANVLVNRKPYLGVVLGIDPSVRGTGLAVVAFSPGEEAQLLASETVKVPRSKTMPECLAEIARAVTRLLEAHPVDCVALEQAIFVQNFQTALSMGTARGAAITAAALRDVPVHDYAPKRIKQAVTGYGRASKEQVMGQVRAILKLKEVLPSDEADAAATAICHALTKRSE